MPFCSFVCAEKNKHYVNRRIFSSKPFWNRLSIYKHVLNTFVSSFSVLRHGFYEMHPTNTSPAFIIQKRFPVKIIELCEHYVYFSNFPQLAMQQTYRMTMNYFAFLFSDLYFMQIVVQSNSYIDKNYH